MQFNKERNLSKFYYLNMERKQGIKMLEALCLNKEMNEVYVYYQGANKDMYPFAIITIQWDDTKQANYEKFILEKRPEITL